MALKKCRECGKKVSTEAATCPSCGVPNPTFKQTSDYEKRKKDVDEYYSKTQKTTSEPTYSYGYGDVKMGEKKVKLKADGKYFFNGTESLAITFWGYFIGANVVINLLTYAIGGDDSGVIILLTIFWIIWNILAVMGVFNAADIYKALKINNGETYGYATAAKIATVILILSAIGNNISTLKLIIQ